jgi:hypothetical protein
MAKMINGAELVERWDAASLIPSNALQALNSFSVAN